MSALRTFQLTRTFGRFETFDLVVFGGEGPGPPGDSRRVRTALFRVRATRIRLTPPRRR